MLTNGKLYTEYALLPNRAQLDLIATNADPGTWRARIEQIERWYRPSIADRPGQKVIKAGMVTAAAVILTATLAVFGETFRTGL